MKIFCAVLLSATLLPMALAAKDDETPTEVVQQLLKSLSRHDGQAARALFAPDAMLFSSRSDGATVGVPSDKWVERLGASKDVWLERIWNTKVLTHGSIAVVWADYDFHLNGKFSHCGIDCFNLLKTTQGWKIVAIADTRETSSCTPSPLGPPSK